MAAASPFAKTFLRYVHSNTDPIGKTVFCPLTGNGLGSGRRIGACPPASLPASAPDLHEVIPRITLFADFSDKSMKKVLDMRSNEVTKGWGFVKNPR
jgi:hypothetical protein